MNKLSSKKARSKAFIITEIWNWRESFYGFAFTLWLFAWNKAIVYYLAQLYSRILEKVKQKQVCKYILLLWSYWKPYCHFQGLLCVKILINELPDKLFWLVIRFHLSIKMFNNSINYENLSVTYFCIPRFRGKVIVRTLGTMLYNKEFSFIARLEIPANTFYNHAK